MKTNNHVRIGRRGEKLAENYLKQKGYTVLERNYRYGRYEIDLIARHDEWTVFVEVKTRTGDPYGPPEVFIDDYKILCLQKASAHYRATNYSAFWRYDIVAVLLCENEIRIRHFEDAIWA